MYLIEKIQTLLGQQKILWVGGGHYLAHPTIAGFLCGSLVFSSEESSEVNDTGFLINLENFCPRRPDWNRVTDKQTYDLFPQELSNEMLSAWSGTIVFPYYVSIYAWRLAELLGSQVIGNPPLAGESLYLRGNARSIAKKAGMITPRTVCYKANCIPDFNQLLSNLDCDRLVITPPYSDGGAWVYPVTDEHKFVHAVSDIAHHFPDENIEITPYYEGISMNLNVCNVYDSETGCCSVVVYPPSVQIIGDPTLSDEKLRYCGCDFRAASEFLVNLDTDKLFTQATNIGKLMFQNYGWKGLFGIDFIARPDGSLVFLEINPRLQSSTHVLDIELRDETNPILLHIASFLGAKSNITYDINMMDQAISTSMLISYNQNTEDMMTVSTKTKYPGIYGFPKEGKPVEPGGVLFRQKKQGRILGSDLKTIDKTQSIIIRDQIKSSFEFSERSVSIQK